MADEQLIEEVADKIEEVADVTRRLTGREVGFFVAGSGVGVALGFGIGYFVLEKRVKTKYEKLADEEIAKMRKHFEDHRAAMQKIADGPKPALDKVMEDLGYQTRSEQDDQATARREFTQVERDAIEEANRNHPGEEEEELRVVTAASAEGPEVIVEEQHVFVGTPEPDPVWDYAVETRGRRPDVPYIIHVDEFNQNEPVHEQITYTYYEVDDVLADQRDQTVDDMDAVIGLGNLGRWGHGSGDVNIVYIRNEELHIDAEVIRDRGSYEAQVSGSIRHSASRMRRPQRKFDDD